MSTTPDSSIHLIESIVALGVIAVIIYFAFIKPKKK